MITTRIAALLLSTLTLTLTACPSPAPPAAPKPRTVDEVLARAKADLDALRAIVAARPRAAMALAKLNGQLQMRNYYRRVPRAPSVETLQAALEAHGARTGATVRNMAATPQPGEPRVLPDTIPAQNRFDATLADVRSILDVRFDLVATPQQAAAFVEALPVGVERLLVVTSLQRNSDGATIFAEAYWEPQRRAPTAKPAWPAAAERLKEGLVSDTPELQASPPFVELLRVVGEGQKLLPDAEEALRITSDFPLWETRHRFFDERSAAVLAVDAKKMLGAAQP